MAWGMFYRLLDSEAAEAEEDEGERLLDLPITPGISDTSSRRFRRPVINKNFFLIDRGAFKI